MNHQTGMLHPADGRRRNQSWALLLRQNWQWLLMQARSDGDAATNYDLLGAPPRLRTDGNLPTVNMGYWKGIRWDEKDAIGRATDALFRLVGEAAELGPDDQKVLDAGCGFGTNAIYAQKTFGVQRIVGLNVSNFQLKWCRRLSEAEGLSDRLDFHKGSATAMPFADGSFDKVVCVEAAFHFRPRRAFFKEAFRVLRPGGRLALSDLMVVPPRTALERLNLGILRRGLQIPAENVYGPEHYKDELLSAGFRIEAAESIGQDVIAPYSKWAGRDPLRDLPEVRLFQLLGTMTFHVYPWDYYLFKVRKP